MNVGIMLNNKSKVLINGCSFSRGPDSWPYHLAKLNNYDIVNLAQAGAGNTYIQESTIQELSQRQYDLVIVMWSGLSRFDIKVENINYFSKTRCTSQYQKTRNDWKDKVIHPVNDQDYVDDNWVFGVGYINNDKELINTGLLDGIYKYLGSRQFEYHSLVKMISLQSFLKSQDIPYVFTFYNDYLALLSASPLYRLLDQRNMFTDKNIYTMAKKFGDLDETNHPMSTTHAQWAELLKEFINAKIT